MISIANLVRKRDDRKDDFFPSCRIVCKSLSKLNLKDVADLSQGPKAPKPSTSAFATKTPTVVAPKVVAAEEKPSQKPAVEEKKEVKQSKEEARGTPNVVGKKPTTP